MTERSEVKEKWRGTLRRWCTAPTAGGWWSRSTCTPPTGWSDFQTWNLQAFIITAFLMIRKQSWATGWGTEEAGRLVRILARLFLTLWVILHCFQEATKALPLQPGEGQGGVLEAVQFCGGEVPGHLQEYSRDPHYQHHTHQCSYGNHFRDFQHISGKRCLKKKVEIHYMMTSLLWYIELFLF